MAHGATFSERRAAIHRFVSHVVEGTPPSQWDSFIQRELARHERA
jgi:hypothetical protein